MIDPRIEPATPFTETELTRIEELLGRPLHHDGGVGGANVFAGRAGLFGSEFRRL